ncbi:hypothetical protein THERMOS_2221 [Bathymodiolus thermophilus thioautotrophic gill symbiont]|uniref:Uncharacterized protein n=1 Tax=Bathymodiolus thermophilus thioautotrophic gill symbiont TaxID=2360 RepID=A0A8H8XFK5_9GAMM|nr:hypothetical protein THERMOS_2221 [Bathymodiolus thermophilus thioautotrophic gill symbiont]
MLFIFLLAKKPNNEKQKNLKFILVSVKLKTPPFKNSTR